MKKLISILGFSLIGLASINLFNSCDTKKQEMEMLNKDQWIISAPAEDKYCEVFDNNTAIIPNGRYITPVGKIIKTAPHPYGLKLSPNGKIAVTANSGTNPISINIIKNIDSDNPEVIQVPNSYETDKGILESVFMGLAFSNDSKLIYVSGGHTNKIYIFSTETGKKVDEIDCKYIDKNNNFTDGYIGDMTITEDGNYLYILDQINFRVIKIETKTKNIVENIPTGRYPFGINLSKDEKMLNVANVGMYEYQLLKGLTKDNINKLGLDFPTSAFGSKESIEGYKVIKEKDTIIIPGLGDINGDESFSVWNYSLEKGKTILKNKVKTGFLIGEKIDGIPAVGGSSPNSIVSNDKYVFVSNGSNDCISVIDIKQGKEINKIFLKPDNRLSKFRGVIPFGLEISKDGKYLFVAESGINAVGVIDINTNPENMKVLGHIPTGWFPAKIQTTNDGKKIIVTSAKGFGSGANGGVEFENINNKSHKGRSPYVGGLMNGIVSVIDIPDASKLKEYSNQVINNNFKFTKADDVLIKKNQNNPIPLFQNEKETPIKYIVFISKENRTYDEVFGQVKNGKGDPSLARYGKNVTFSNKNKFILIQNADIMPNHLALAERFGISDNFYVDSDHSADGHRWLTCTYPNEFTETNVSAAYGGNKKINPDSKSKGALVSVGASGAIYPEDYNEAGSMWEHLERNGINFFNFGFSVELAHTFSDSTLKYGGVKHIANYPIPAPLFDKSSKKYATYNMAIPDQFRFKTFVEEYNEKWVGKGKELPRVLTIILPNDHGAGERPNAGFPFRESYMVDNDLALGRLIEFLSNTPYWKNMAIVITEDDSQDGVDHIDAHRSILMVISPYSKKNHVSHKHYSFGSIFKTFWNILGIPYLNQFDATATDLSDFFTDKPDFTPYKVKPIDKRVFDPSKALNPFDEGFDWKAVFESPELDKVEDFIKNKQK